MTTCIPPFTTKENPFTKQESPFSVKDCLDKAVVLLIDEITGRKLVISQSSFVNLKINELPN